ncbi:MAG: YraN family protein [Acidimicrobiia bacterium]|nr:YraN family protein [Acidimicrobiia bacterium]
MTPPGHSERSQVGHYAEELAVEFLCRNGARLLARNVKVMGGEIDLVALIEGEKAAVEVRSVTSPPSGPFPEPHPLDAFDRAKARQVRRLANALRCPRVDLVAVRFHSLGVDLHWVKRAA